MDFHFDADARRFTGALDLAEAAIRVNGASAAQAAPPGKAPPCRKFLFSPSGKEHQGILVTAPTKSEARAFLKQTYGLTTTRGYEGVLLITDARQARQASANKHGRAARATF